jgi:hypothetical protein
MCQLLNLKAPNVGVYKVQSLLSTECANLRMKLCGLLQGKAVSVTTDAWTSCNNITFITCTAHFIDPKTWLLHHIPLGLFQKSGTSHAEDVVRYVEGIWERYNIEMLILLVLYLTLKPLWLKLPLFFVTEQNRSPYRLIGKVVLIIF